jgi:hypothetical protein
VERRLVGCEAEASRQYCPSMLAWVGVEPRGEDVGQLGTLLGPEGSSESLILLRMDHYQVRVDAWVRGGSARILRTTQWTRASL